MSGLRGRTVAVTRAEHQAGPLARLLSACGATVLPVPTIAIQPPHDGTAVDAALASLDRFDWVVFTSANAVSAVWSRLDHLHGTVPPTLHVAAVGPATAEALRSRGVRAPVLPDTFQGDALARAIPGLSGSRVLLPRGNLAREATAEAFRQAGAAVETVTVYRTVPVPIAPATLAVLREGVDAITFTSPSTARHFLTALGDEARLILRSTVVACLGPVTAEAVRALGITDLLVAPEATSAALVHHLEAHFA